jgi:ABC-type phosphate transport system permease subunit
MFHNEQPRLQFQWLEVAFAIAWIGALSLYWIHIKMNPRFQSVLGFGIRLQFPASLIYVSTVYAVAIVAIVSAGLGIYLAMRGDFKLSGFLRGLIVNLIVTVPSLVAGLFLNGRALPATVMYKARWLPVCLALWLSIRVGRPTPPYKQQDGNGIV